MRPRTTKIQVLVSHIFEHVRSLYHLSILLHRPTVRDKFIRSVTNNSKQSSLKVFVEYDCAHVAEKHRQWSGAITDTPADGEEVVISPDVLQRRDRTEVDELWSLCQRLGKANTRRREQLRFWVEHPEKRGEAPESNEPAPFKTPTTSIAPLPDVNVDIEARSQVSTEKPEGSKTSSTEKTITTTLTKQSYSTVAQSILDDEKTVSGTPRTVYEPSEVRKS